MNSVEANLSSKGCVTLRTVLASLAAGDSTVEILDDFPTLKPEDVQAAIAFAAASAEEDLPVRPIPPSC